MGQVRISGNDYQVTAASDVHDDAETLEFRTLEGPSGRTEIWITQIGDYGSPDLHIRLSRELPLPVVEEAIRYARGHFGLSPEVQA
ncbi:hypothetical protein [Saccharopolyspora sp. NPDC002686]|uniref:hypothetical protein n=1 Tax=Saccharopolyspora sp. NPDC002686 TaxID=3154541 RepID=UPI003327DE23